MDPQLFLQGLTRETAIRRDDQGRWFYQDDPLTHPKLVRSFNRWLERAEDGRYCLRNALHWVYVHLEGPPRFVHAVQTQTDGLALQLSDETQELLQPDTLCQDGRGALYCQLHSGLWARFDNPAAVQLAEHIAEDAAGPYVTVNGHKVHPPVLDAPPY